MYENKVINNYKKLNFIIRMNSINYDIIITQALSVQKGHNSSSD